MPKITYRHQEVLMPVAASGYFPSTEEWKKYWIDIPFIGFHRCYECSSWGFSLTRLQLFVKEIIITDYTYKLEEKNVEAKSR